MVKVWETSSPGGGHHQRISDEGRVEHPALVLEAGDDALVEGGHGVSPRRVAGAARHRCEAAPGEEIHPGVPGRRGRRRVAADDTRRAVPAEPESQRGPGLHRIGHLREPAGGTVGIGCGIVETAGLPGQHQGLARQPRLVRPGQLVPTVHLWATRVARQASNQHEPSGPERGAPCVIVRGGVGVEGGQDQSGVLRSLKPRDQAGVLGCHGRVGSGGELHPSTRIEIRIRVEQGLEDRLVGLRRLRGVVYRRRLSGGNPVRPGGRARIDIEAEEPQVARRTVRVERVDSEFGARDDGAGHPVRSCRKPSIDGRHERALDGEVERSARREAEHRPAQRESRHEPLVRYQPAVIAGEARPDGEGGRQAGGVVNHGRPAARRVILPDPDPGGARGEAKECGARGRTDRTDRGGRVHAGLADLVVQHERRVHRAESAQVQDVGDPVDGRDERGHACPERAGGRSLKHERLRRAAPVERRRDRGPQGDVRTERKAIPGDGRRIADLGPVGRAGRDRARDGRRRRDPHGDGLRRHEERRPVGLRRHGGARRPGRRRVRREAAQRGVEGGDAAGDVPLRAAARRIERGVDAERRCTKGVEIVLGPLSDERRGHGVGRRVPGVEAADGPGRGEPRAGIHLGHSQDRTAGRVPDDVPAREVDVHVVRPDGHRHGGEAERFHDGWRGKCDRTVGLARDFQDDQLATEHVLGIGESDQDPGKPGRRRGHGRDARRRAGRNGRDGE